MDAEQPHLVTGSPPCESFSRLIHITKFKRKPGAFEAQREIGRSRLKVACRMYGKQLQKGRYFLHEHPWAADSWQEPCVKEIAQRGDVFVVKGPMCKWGMTAIDSNGQQGYVRKETGWMTNSPVLARVLEGTCSNNLGGEWHRHIYCMGGIAKAAQVYPPKLVRAVLQGLKEQLKLDGHLSSFEETSAGPSPHHDWFEEEPDWSTYVDDSAGTPLRTDLVVKAREEELQWVKKEKICHKVPLRQCYDRTGKAPIDTKWLDINKGDDERPNYRSRLVAREIKARKKESEKLSAAQLFMATPPVESFYMLISIWMSVLHSASGRQLKLGIWDVSRAHFMGKAEREVYIVIPDEDREGDQEKMCGLLDRSMYGTQDASNIFQRDYTKLFADCGFVFGKACPAIMHHAGLDARGLVHRDDFTVLAYDHGLNETDKILKSKYTVKQLARLGFEEKDDKEATFLNRVISVSKDESGRSCIEVEADSRHVDLIIKNLGLENAKPVDTPSIKKSALEAEAIEREPALTPALATKFRSCVMRGAYLSQDRVDITEAVKSLAQAMKTPKPGDELRLKRLGRYLKGKPDAAIICRQQKLPERIAVSGDSDWAGE